MVRFDQPCVSASHAINYFSMHMASDDYLTEQGRVEMVWVGRDARRLGLSGQVEKDEFQRLCEGKHPVSGERLGSRERGPVRRVCYFGKISAPKDVSIAYLVGVDSRIAGWWQEAVADTVKEIEAVTATRLRKGGVDDKDRLTGSMVAAQVTHDASRALDPQLHTHVCIMNVTYDEHERQWKSVQPGNYFRHQAFFREVCYNKLARRMVAGGYEIEKSRSMGFNLKGFPPELRRQFSKRREEIERVARSIGATTQDELQTITARTRHAKRHVDGETLRGQWREEAGDHLAWVETAIAKADGTRKSVRVHTPTEAVDWAAAHVYERNSAINEKVLLGHALVYGRGDVSLEAVRAELDRRIISGDLIRYEDQLVSCDTLAMEREYLDWALTNKRRHSDLGRVSDLPDELKPEQRRAIADILHSRDQVVILQGDAGTGKTTSLKEIVRGIEKAGGQVFACAPSSGATQGMREKVTPQADTLQQLLVNYRLQQRIAGRIIIVDEAGLVSSRQMRDLCRIAKLHQNRLILVGDVKQHTSVEAGDALRALQEYGGVEAARLTEIRRQRDPFLRRAVKLLAKKQAWRAFGEFYRQGAVQEIREPKKLMETAAADYVRAVAEKKSCLVISPVWSDIHRFTDEVRPRLRAAEMLVGEDRAMNTYSSFGWTAAERRDVRNYQKGDVLAFRGDTEEFRKGDYATVEERVGVKIVVIDEKRQRCIFDPKERDIFDVGLSRSIGVAVGEWLLIRANLKDQKLHNGEIVQVGAIRPDGALVLKDKRIIPPQFRQFTYGYATTSHASQGKSIDRGIVLMAGDGIKAGNLKQAYVSHSRFEESHMTYTSDIYAAMKAMARPQDRELAIEIADERVRRWKIFAKLTNQAEAWAESRKLSLAARQVHGSRMTQGTNA